MAIYSYVIGFMVACISYVVYLRCSDVNISIVVKPEKLYDYIVVGAGTAGSVLAARLSEDPKTKVLLVEAGDHMGYFTKIPLTATSAQQGANDWAVSTTSQKYSSFGLWNQVQFLPRGKGLGGSGQINYLLHSFGLPGDYDRWSQRGFHGWSMENMRPYFLRAFGSTKSDFDSGHCSLDGYCPGTKAPMKLKRIGEHNDLMKVFQRASELKTNRNVTFLRATATVSHGMRHSTFDAYLKPALKRNNLHVLLKTQAVSVRFENRTASSLYILQNHRQLDNIFVNKEIILSAGAIKTPQILMLSGIGPQETLRRLRIRTVSYNERVGRNLHDHVNMPLYVSVRAPLTITLDKVFSAHTAWDYFWKGEGLLSFPPVAGVEVQGSSQVLLFSMGTASERLLRDLSNYKPKVFRETFPFHNHTSKEGFMFLCSCAHPRSRGEVTLQDPSTSVPPLVNTNYLQQNWDVRCTIKALRRAEELILTKPFQDIGARVHWPRPERCLVFWNYTREQQTGIVRRRKKAPPNQAVKQIKMEGTRISSTSTSPPDEYLECIIREVAVTGHHAAGTCAGAAVVDDELRVRSVSGLRVVDASVLPSPVSMFPNSVLVAMAERASDLIRKSIIG